MSSTQTTSLRLYTYYRSSAAYRVRIALHIKDLNFKSIPIHLLKDGGEQYQDKFRTLSPQAMVPVLIDGDMVLTQSLAIVEYLNEQYPIPPLLPARPTARAAVREIAHIVAMDLHPLNNLRVINYLKEAGLKSKPRAAWIQHWMIQGLTAIEQHLQNIDSPGPYAGGDRPDLADLCIIPQLYNAQRHGCDLAPYAKLRALEKICMAHPAFAKARPENQPDAPPDQR